MRVARALAAVMMIAVGITCSALAQSHQPSFAATFQAPADRVWQVIADVIVSPERMLPGGDLAFNKLYQPKTISRDKGVAVFETVMLGWPGTGLSGMYRLQELLGQGPSRWCYGLDRIAAGVGRCLTSIAAALKITPSIQTVTFGEERTEVRISMTIEAWSIIWGWGWKVQSNSALEQITLNAIQKRLAALPAPILAPATPSPTPVPAVEPTPVP